MPSITVGSLEEINSQHDSGKAQKQPCSCKGPVLICDGDPINLELLQRMLQHRFEIKSEQATQGREAVEKFMENRSKVCCDVKFRLVIMDLNLPDMEGFDAIEKIMEH